MTPKPWTPSDRSSGLSCFRRQFSALQQSRDRQGADHTERLGRASAWGWSRSGPQPDGPALLRLFVSPEGDVPETTLQALVPFSFLSGAAAFSAKHLDQARQHRCRRSRPADLPEKAGAAAVNAFSIHAPKCCQRYLALPAIQGYNQASWPSL